jgi:hypothetical protein
MSPQIPGIVEGQTRSIPGALGQADPALPEAVADALNDLLIKRSIDELSGLHHHRSGHSIAQSLLFIGSPDQYCANEVGK